LLLAADAAMYRAKSRQPGSYWIFDPAIDGQASARTA
jgi:hypothetical protein